MNKGYLFQFSFKNAIWMILLSNFLLYILTGTLNITTWATYIYTIYNIPISYLIVFYVLFIILVIISSISITDGYVDVNGKFRDKEGNIIE